MRRVSSPTFVGRGAELATMESALERAARGEPSVLLVAGESGVGKSRLLAEYAERAEAGDARVLTGDCVDLGEGELPYAPLLAALRQLRRELDPAELSDMAGPGSGGMALLDPDAAGGGELFGDSVAQGRLFELLLRLFGRLGESGPLLLVIEDLHWADSSTRQFLSFLSRAVRSERMVVAASYRSDELHRRHPLRPLLAELERVERVTRIDVVPFSRGEQRDQVAGILGSPPERALSEALYSRSEGNAFFAEELLAAMDDDRSAMPLPETFRDALMVRVEALSTDTQELLRLVAAAGRGVTHRLLAAVWERPEAALLDTLREGVAHHVLIEGRADDSYEFRHALIREAVYEDLLPGERGKLHIRLAEALSGDASLSADSIGPAAELAWHWLQAHELPHALRASVEAAGQADNLHAPAEAGRHLETAIELWDRVDDPEATSETTLVDLTRRAAERMFLAGNEDRAVALAEQAIELVGPDGDHVLMGLLRERLGRYLWISGRDTEAARQYDLAVEAMPAQPPSAERARVLAAKAQVLMLLGRLPESRDLARDAIAMARGSGARGIESHARNTHGVANAGLGRADAGIEELREVLAIDIELGSLDDLHRDHVNLAEALDQSGRVQEAIAVSLEGATLVRERGLGRSYSDFLLGEAANRHLRTGSVDEADRLSAEALENSSAGVTAGLIHVVRAEVAIIRDDPEAADRHLAEARRLHARAVGSMWQAPAYAARVDLAGRRGDIAEVRALITQARAIMSAAEEVPYYVAPLYVAALSAEATAAGRARAQGDDAAALDALDSGRRLWGLLDAMQESAVWEGPPPPQLLADIAYGRAELSRLEGHREIRLWQPAIAHAEAIGNVLPAAWARLRQGEALLEDGDRAEAEAVLREAHAIAERTGAAYLLRQLEVLARRGGFELVPQPETSGEDPRPRGLTKRELEVLRLLGAGRTNREIGEELFISEKTASVHVSRILAKLEVRNRGEAGAVAHRLGLVEG